MDAEISHGPWHTGTTVPWEDIWLREQPMRDKPYFATCFRQKPSLSEYKKRNGSIKGWHSALPGIIAIDLDRHGEHAEMLAHFDARELIKRFDGFGINRNTYKIFISGMKGLHFQFLYHVFGPLLNEPVLYEYMVGKEMYYWHQEVISSILKILCGSIEYDTNMSQSLRMFRVPNSAHNERKDRFKVPVTHEEVISLDSDKFYALNKAPRNLPTVCSVVPDPALIAMITAGLATIGLATMVPGNGYDTHDTARASVTSAFCPALPLPPLPQERQEVLLLKLIPLIQNHKSIRLAWNSIPFRKNERFVSSSQYDFRVAKELFLLSWNESDILDSCRLRPQEDMDKNSEYWSTTMKKAAKSALEVKTKYPSNQARLRQASFADAKKNIETFWLWSSQVWRNRIALGSLCQIVYRRHLEQAMKNNTDLNEGHWSKVWSCIPRSDLTEGSGRITTKGSIIRAEKLLRETGLLKLVREACPGFCNQYVVLVPTIEQEQRMIDKARAASRAWAEKHRRKKVINHSDISQATTEG